MNKEKCLYPDCDRLVYSRSLCANHYRNASLLVCEKKTTWAKLEANGKAMPRKKHYQNSSTQWFLSLKTKANDPRR